MHTYVSFRAQTANYITNKWAMKLVQGNAHRQHFGQVKK